MSANTDYLGDGDFNFEAAIAGVAAGKATGAAYVVKDHYAYYPAANKFACAICASYLEGNEEIAEEHVRKCYALPDVTSKTFCAVCWRNFSQEHTSAHFNSVGHHQAVERLRANGNNSSIWLMKNGPSFVAPKDSTAPAMPLVRFNGPQRLVSADTIYQVEIDGEDKLKEQIVSAIRAASGNFGTVTAKLGANSPLVVAMRILVSYSTIGTMPCPLHTPTPAYDLFKILGALRKIFPGQSGFFSCSEGGNCTLCGNKMARIDNPKKMAEIITKLANTIVGKSNAPASNDVDMATTIGKRKADTD